MEVSLSAGLLLIITLGDPGAQGATVAGMQGMGVSTPRAAAVADAVAGNAREEQTPNGKILTMGLWAMMLAAKGTLAIISDPWGITTNELGAAPKVHFSIAPITTCVAIILTS